MERPSRADLEARINEAAARRDELQEVRNMSTTLAVFAILLFGCGFVALASMVMPAFMGIIGVSYLFVVIVGLQYLLWGRFMSRRLLRPSEDRERRFWER